jgi:C-terminal processing protease CtpA/Prc
MQRIHVLLAVLCAGLCVACAASAFAVADEQKDKVKPKNAPTLDDATATLTEFVDGKKKESKIDLKYCLKVKGYFDKAGFNIEEIGDGGPATHLTGAGTMLEKGDIITKVDGKSIKSAADYAKALNGAADHDKVKLTVRDVNSSEEVEVEAETAKRQE